MGGQVDRNKDDKAKQGKKNRSRGKDDKAKQGKKNLSRGKDDKAKRGKKQAEHGKANQGMKKYDKAKQAADKAKQAEDDAWIILLAEYKARLAKRTKRPRKPRAAGKPKQKDPQSRRSSCPVLQLSSAQTFVNGTSVFSQTEPRSVSDCYCLHCGNTDIASTYVPLAHCLHCGNTDVAETYGPA